MTRVPPLAGVRLKREVEALGCHYSDYIAYALCQHAGVPMDVPTGEVNKRPDLLEAPGQRVQFGSRVPMAAAAIVTDDAERTGVSIADYVAKILCDRFDVAFEPRVRKKAIRAWQMAAKTEGRLPMTG